MVVFDASFLIPLLDKKANEPEPGARRKLNYLFDELCKANAQIVVPTPALSEYLVGAGDAGPKYLAVMDRSTRFRVADFDTKAAIETAARIREAKDSGDKRSGTNEDWQVIKYDRQIIAIAVVQNVSRIYSNDPHFKKLVGPNGPQVLAFSDLPNPPEDDQRRLDFDKEEDE